VGVQLVERLAADAARTAVFEKQDRPLTRFRDRRVEFVDV
jgi:hypothetical protein